MRLKVKCSAGGWVWDVEALGLRYGVLISSGWYVAWSTAFEGSSLVVVDRTTARWSVLLDFRCAVHAWEVERQRRASPGETLRLDVTHSQYGQV